MDVGAVYMSGTILLGVHANRRSLPCLSDRQLAYCTALAVPYACA
jgi:hypothetical protein